MYIRGENVYSYFFSFFLIFFWVKQLSSGVSNSAKRSFAWFGTPRSLPPPHCWTSSCRCPSVDGPCSLLGPRYAIMVYIWRIGDWKGMERCLRVGGYTGASSSTNIKFYTNYFIFSPLRTPQAYAWW